MRICSIHCVESKDRKTKANHSRSMIRAKLYLCTYRSINHRIRQAYITHSLLPYGVSSEASAPAPALAKWRHSFDRLIERPATAAAGRNPQIRSFHPLKMNPTSTLVSHRIRYHRTWIDGKMEGSVLAWPSLWRPRRLDVR